MSAVDYGRAAERFHQRPHAIFSHEKVVGARHANAGIQRDAALRSTRTSPCLADACLDQGYDRAIAHDGINVRAKHIAVHSLSGNSRTNQRRAVGCNLITCAGDDGFEHKFRTLVGESEVLRLRVPIEPLTWLAGERLQQLFVGIMEDRKSTRLNSSHVSISYAVFCLKK